MVKTLSKQKIEKMLNAFEALNRVPKELRGQWGLTDKNYDYAVYVCEALLKRMRRESRRVISASAEATEVR